MSFPKKSTSSSVSLTAKGPSSSKMDAAASPTVGLKRTATDVEEEQLDEPGDWTPLLRRVFVTRDVGVLRSVSGNDKNKVFSLVGHFADNKVVLVQVWGIHADRTASFFQK